MIAPNWSHLLSPRLCPRSLPLQVAWVGLSSLAFNRWIPREELVERGFEKMVNEYDGKMASEQKVRGTF